MSDEAVRLAKRCISSGILQDAWPATLARAVIALTEERDRLATALREACDLYYTEPEERATGFDPAHRIAELRKLAYE